jgi:ABC-2 type transport system permease protein
MALALVLTFPMVVTVCYLGDPDPGPIITGYLGSLLLAAAYLGIGSFFSSITRSQVIAFVLAVVFCALFFFAGSPSVLNYLRGFLPLQAVEAAESLSIESRFESIQRGVLELRDVAFFVILAAGWLWANVVALEERRCSG